MIVGSIATVSSCTKHPDSPGYEYMPDMYRSQAIEAYVDYGMVKDEVNDEVKDDVKDDAKDEVKDEVKDDVKDEVKDDVKDEVKDDVKDEAGTNIKVKKANNIKGKKDDRKGDAAEAGDKCSDKKIKECEQIGKKCNPKTGRCIKK